MRNTQTEKKNDAIYYMSVSNNKGKQILRSILQVSPFHIHIFCACSLIVCRYQALLRIWDNEFHFLVIPILHVILYSAFAMMLGL